MTLRVAREAIVDKWRPTKRMVDGKPINGSDSVEEKTSQKLTGENKGDCWVK